MWSAGLKWLERTLIVIGIVLGVWVVARMTEALFFQTLPVPPPQSAATPTAPPVEQPGQPALPPEQPPAPPPPERGAWIGRLEAPSVRLAATVLEGSDDATLSRGAGHIEYTPLPGQAGNVGIAGHRDTTFRAVRKLKVGDQLVLTTADRGYKYLISSTTIVDPDDVWVLDPTDRPTLTLVTCYPFNYIGSAPRRYIITATLVSDWDRQAPEPQNP
jgi:sortase A